LFSLLTTPSAPSYLLSLPLLASPSHPSTTCHHTTPPSYTLTTQPTIPTIHTPAYCNPWHKHPPLEWKYTQTHTRAIKPSSPTILPPPPTPLHPALPSSVTFTSCPSFDL
jgi:hypothetical protein